MEVAALPGHPSRRLVLNDIGARVAGAALRRIGEYIRVQRRFAGIEEVETHLRSIHDTFGALTDAQWRHLAVHSAVRTAEGDYRQHYDPAIARTFSWPLTIDVSLWHLWEKITCPVLILHGENSDLLQASTVRDMQSRGPAAKAGMVSAFEVPGCGHAPALMSDDQVSTIEEFLAMSDSGKDRRIAAGS
jgi:pimeloyl-ACP methyl ester carboxylesterase